MTAEKFAYTPFDTDTSPFWNQANVPTECILELSHDEIKKGIHNCQLCAYGKLSKPLPLSNSNARVMIVGMRPDDVLFECQSGKKLGELLEACNMPLHDVYLTSVIKCQEVADPLQCHHHLIGEILTVRPILVITLGYEVARIFSEQPALNAYVPIGFANSTMFMTYSMHDVLQDTSGQAQTILIQHFTYISGQIRGMKTA